MSGDVCTTLALDELLTSITAREVEQMRRVTPQHVLDQADAVRRDTCRLLEEMAQRGGVVGQVPAGDVADWLRLGAVDALRGFLDGSGSTCQHDPHPGRYELVLAVAWRPGLVVCARCAHLLRAARAADATCDRCGHRCAGMDAGDPIYPQALTVGALTYAASTCGGCRPEQTSAASPDPGPSMAGLADRRTRRPRPTTTRKETR